MSALSRSIAHTLGLQLPSKAELRAAVSRSRHRLSGAEVRAVVMCVQQQPGAVHCLAWQRYSGFLEKSSNARWSQQALESSLAGFPHPQHLELNQY